MQFVSTQNPGPTRQSFCINSDNISLPGETIRWCRTIVPPIHSNLRCVIQEKEERQSKFSKMHEGSVSDVTGTTQLDEGNLNHLLLQHRSSPQPHPHPLFSRGFICSHKNWLKNCSTKNSVRGSCLHEAGTKFKTEAFRRFC